MKRWVVIAVWGVLAGCSASSKVVRLDTGSGDPLVYVPRRDLEPLDVSQKQFKQAVALHLPSVPAVQLPLEYARQLWEVPRTSGWYRYEGRSQRLMPSEQESHANLRLLPEDEELKRRYLQWCERTWGPGDCLRLLEDKPFLDGEARYALAMAIAQSKVLGSMKDELARLVSPHAVVATLVGGLTMYVILLSLPEPVTKGVAALLTLGAVAYLGWDTVWRLIDGWLVLMKEVDRAKSFDELSAAGEKFGAVMGEKAARAFVMLATVAMGNTAAGMATALPRLPGAGQAGLAAEAQLHTRWAAPALAQVESVALSAEGATIALAPGAVAMAEHERDAQRTSVYVSLNAQRQVQYVGLTDDMARRAAEHLRERGLQIQKLLGGLSREDARAVEQVLIEIHGLEKNGGTLLNRINSIARDNPKYAALLRRGLELLESIGYQGN